VLDPAAGPTNGTRADGAGKSVSDAARSTWKRIGRSEALH
jgi:hypothetical protein